MSGPKTIRVALPSAEPGGLDATCDFHFGRCPCFTLVDLEDGRIAGVEVVQNPPHGDCLGPVRLLAENRAQGIVVGGIGMRPLLALRQAGLEVYLGRGGSVGELVEAFTAGRLSPVDESSVCRGR